MLAILLCTCCGLQYQLMITAWNVMISLKPQMLLILLSL